MIWNRIAGPVLQYEVTDGSDFRAHAVDYGGFFLIRSMGPGNAEMSVCGGSLDKLRLAVLDMAVCEGAGK